MIQKVSRRRLLPIRPLHDCNLFRGDAAGFSEAFRLFNKPGTNWCVGGLNAGAGKTCLLRIVSNMPVPGVIEKDEFQGIEQEVKYVADVNVVPPMDTVEEVLQFYAEFILSDIMSPVGERAGRPPSTLPNVPVEHIPNKCFLIHDGFQRGDHRTPLRACLGACERAGNTHVALDALGGLEALR